MNRIDDWYAAKGFKTWGEAAAALGISRTTIWRLRKLERLPKWVEMAIKAM